jgi:RNA polymerase sigma factor (sigma-70 family)
LKCFWGANKPDPFESPLGPLKWPLPDSIFSLLALSTTQLHIHTDLIEACKRGDRQAQFRLYKLYSKAMYNICLRMLGEVAAAEDALQEAFLNAFDKIHTFEGRASFGAWIKRIVINKCLSLLQRRKVILEPLEEHQAVQEPAVEDTGVTEAALDGSLIHEAIQSLPEGCRVIFTLYQLEGYDHQEISEILGVSVSTSKSQFHRAKKLLRKKLAGELDQ